MHGNDGKHKKTSKSGRAAALLLALLTAVTSGAGPVRAAAEENKAAVVESAETNGSLTGTDDAETGTEENEQNSAAAGGSDTSSADSAGSQNASSSSDSSSGQTASDSTSAESASGDEVSEEDLDYTLGRPMTEEEIEEQRMLEPSRLTDSPVITGPKAEDVNIDEVILDGSRMDADDLPSSFDSRSNNWVTSVKNQGEYIRNAGTCWAFSAIANAETTLLSKGLTIGGSTVTKDSLDLSELQLAYFFFHPVEDALGNTAGDKVELSSNTNYLAVGNHGIFTTLCLANWTGVTNESLAPYETASTDLTLDDDLCYSSDTAHLQNAYWVKMSDVDAVKLLIQKFGSVSASLYWDSLSFLNVDTSAYYNNNSAMYSLNHMVTIVGWDDDYMKENFEDEPSENGAWLVKNSYGSDWGDEGYFWLSYEDEGLTGGNGANKYAFGYVYDFESSDNYDHVYEYDGTYGFATQTVASGSSTANVYTVSGSSGQQRLEAVSIGLLSTDVDYSIQIYKDPEEGDPSSGEALLTEPQTGTLSYMGYATVPLDETVVLDEGDTFSVVFTLSTSDSGSIKVLKDKTYTNSFSGGTSVTFTNHTEDGQSFVSSGSEWQDLNVSGTDSSGNPKAASVRIKAFTSDWQPIESLELSEASLNLAVGENSSLTAQASPEDNDDDGTVTWTSSDEKVAVVSADGTVTAVGCGTAVIRATAGYQPVSAECKVTVVPATPVLTGIKETTVGLTVSWKKTAGDGYRVYRRLGTSTRWSQIREITGSSTTSWSDTTVIKGNTYYYTVRAFCKNGSTYILSGFDPTGIGAKDTLGLDTVKLGSAKGYSYRKIRVTWAQVTGAGGYLIYRKVSGGSWTRVGTAASGSTVSWIDTVPSASTAYIYTVKAYAKRSGIYIYSGYNTTGVSGRAIPATPVLSGVASSSTGLTVKWGKVSGCNGYIVYRKTATSGWARMKELSGAANVSWKDTKARKGVYYYYTVRAFFKSGSTYSLSWFDAAGVRGKR